MKKIFSSPMIVTQYFGQNPNMYSQYGLLGHDGLDIIPSDAEDHRIFAYHEGKVVQNYFSSTYGETIIVYDKHTNWAIRYAHMSQVFVKIGEFIRSGQLIGIMGNTGNVTGPHLHTHIVPCLGEDLEARYPGNGYKGRMDPLAYISGGTVFL
jgi:murein DD-endopeptidase MepM/ murein hydrolase activator NlpD